MKQITIILGISLLLFSCGKKTTTPPVTTETTTQKIQKKWNITNIKDIMYVGQQTTTIDTTINNYGVSGDYVEFQTNGKAVMHFFGGTDTVNYSIISDTKLTFDGDEFTINTLNQTDFVFTYYNRTDPDYYDNVVILKR
jgi:hypothetical protein